MSNWMIALIGMLSGFGIGSLWGFVKIHKNEKKEELIIQKELDKFKFDPHDAEFDRFVKSINSRPEPTFEETMAETEHPEDEEADDPEYEDEDLDVDEEDENEESDEEESVDVDDEDENEEPDDDDEYEQEVSRYSGTGEPYLIQEQTYFRMHDGYDKISLAWSEDEQLLRDDEDDTVLDISKFIGYEALEHFGDYSDPRCVYVRNERMRADFEVTKE